jgi:predicted transcriptional regulator
VFKKRTTVRDGIRKIQRALDTLKEEIANGKEESAEHLQAINEIMNEVHSFYESHFELETKFHKLSDRFDELMLFVGHPSMLPHKGYHIAELTSNEREVFMALYALVNENGGATYTSLCRRCGMTLELVQSYITNLIAKGVPVRKRRRDNEVFVMLDRSFCELQAKENIANTNELISEKVISK